MTAVTPKTLGVRQDALKNKPEPADAKWLTDSEKRMLAADLHTPSGSHHSFGQVARDPRVYLLAFAYFTMICGIYTVSFWLTHRCCRSPVTTSLLVPPSKVFLDLLVVGIPRLRTRLEQTVAMLFFQIFV